MNTNDANALLLKDGVFRIVGAAMSILNEIGHGYHEKTYENAMVVESQLSGIPFTQQPSYNLLYKGHHIDSELQKSKTGMGEDSSLTP